MINTSGTNGTDRRSKIKAVILLAALILVLLAFRFTPLREYFTPHYIQSIVDQAGFWAPMVFILLYAAGICLFIPGVVLTGIGAVVFGPYWGFVYVWVGGMIGAAASFALARTLGREYAGSLVGGRLRKYDEAIERNGFATVLYLRLIYAPFNLTNLGLGLTRVHFSDYIVGTGLGIIVGTFIITLFIGSIRDVWASGDWGRLISAKVLFPFGLFLLSLMIPKAIKKIRGEK